MELNPFIPREQAFVDGYDFTAYNSAGFEKFDSVKIDSKNLKLTPPELGFGEWWSYLTNSMKLAPIPDDMKFGEIPEGVLRLGGTFVVKGNNIVYQWSDKIPGDHPSVDEVYSIAQNAAQSKVKEFSMESVFKNMFS